MSKPASILINPIGLRDPWNQWEKQPVKGVNVPYGAALSIVEHYADKLTEVIFLFTQEAEKARPLLEMELQTQFPDVPYHFISTGIINPSDLSEVAEKMDCVLLPYRQRANTTFYINESSGTQQMTQYLQTLFLLGYFHQPYKQAQLIQVNDPNKLLENEARIVAKSEPRSQPVKALFDASHIARLLQQFEYAAALRLVQNSTYSKYSESIKFFKACVDLDDKIMMSESARQRLQEPLRSYVENVFNHLNNDIDLLFRAFAYWGAQIKFKKQEWQDAVLRTAALREQLALDCVIRSTDIQPYLSDPNKKPIKFYANRLPDERRAKLCDIGNAFYKDNYRDHDLIELSSDSLLLILELFQHPFAPALKASHSIVFYRNRYAHGVFQLHEKGKIESFIKHLPLMMDTAYPGEHGLWDTNFFEEANALLLKALGLEWLLPSPKWLNPAIK